MQAPPRLELLSRAGWDRHTPNLLRAIAHHAELLDPFLGFSAALATRGALPRRDSELLALRAAWNCRSEFEWGHHAVYARAAGLSDAEIDAVAVGSDAPGWSDADRALLRAADELHAHKAITEATWAALAARLGAAQLVEIPFVVGQYTMLSMVAGALRVPLEDGLPRLPRAAASGS
jgi:alkylhydroperoxidase family enzyme